MTKTLADFEPLWPAEQTLADEVHTGHDVAISSGVPPEDAAKELRIRASFLRYLALGGCDTCAPGPKGVRVEGAYIEGDGDPRGETRGLDLEGAELPGDLAFLDCRIPDLLLLRSSRVKSLFLNRSWLGQGLEADGMQAAGGVRLDRVVAKNKVMLTGASLGGDLDCDEARLSAGESGVALSAERLTATGSFFLRKVEAGGEMCLRGASLGQNLECNGARLTVHEGGIALSADGMRVAGTFFWRSGAQATGRLDLTNAHVGSLVDDPACWPEAGDLILNGFVYDGIGSGPTDAKARLDWLARQDPKSYGDDFWPQPYEQLAAVFRKMGHRHDAQKVLVEKERLQRKARRGRLWKRHRYLRLTVAWLADFILSTTVRYGHRPLLALAWLAGFWLLGSLVFGAAAANGALKPNTPFVLRAPEWVLCGAEITETVSLSGKETPQAGRAAPDQSQYACFLDQPEAASYPKFNAPIYSADTLLPVVALEMQEFWVPDERHTWARGYLWVQIIVGWGLSLLAVAGFSGLIKSD